SRVPLSDPDNDRARALDTLGALTRLYLMRFQDHPGLCLRLARDYPGPAHLVYPLVVKIPVVSLRYYVDVVASDAFAAIRAADHPQGDDIIAYLYELLFLQQK